jgi:acyl carrier protein
MRSEAEIHRDLAEIFRDVFLDDQLTPSPTMTAADVPGWDSFKQIEILAAAEARFGIRFATRELGSLANIGDLARAIAIKLG